MAQIKAFSSYEEALEAERQREKFARQTRQGAFEASFVSFDGNKELYYPLAAVISSRTKDDSVFLKTAQRIAHAARERVRRNAPECLKVFSLILKYGKERQKSIWEMVNEIKKQSGALKRTRSTKPCANSTEDNAEQSAISSVSKPKMTAKSHLKKRKNARSEKS